MPRLPLVPARRRPRRQLFAPMAAGLAARRIQAVARGFLARRQVAQMRRPRLMSPMDISKIKRRKTQGQIPKRVTRGVMPKYRIGSLIGTVKSKRKVTGKMDPLKVTTHSDRCCNIDQSMVAYWGFSDASSQDDQLLMGVRALVQMFVRRAGLKVSTVDQQFNESYLYDATPETDIRLNRITIQFLRRNPDGTKEIGENIVNVTETDSVSSISDAIFTDIKERAAGPVNPGLGEWPVRAILQTSGSVSPTSGSAYYKTFATYDLTNCMVDFTYMRKFKWQNVTPADNTEAPGDQSRYNLNDVHANPLSGKIYHFKGPVPVVRAAQLDNADLENLKGVQALIQPSALSGIGTSMVDGQLDCGAFRDNGDYNGVLYNAFQQPFKSQTFFKNVDTEDKVYMPPGGYKQLIRRGKITMNFTRFTKATVCPAAVVTGGASTMYVGVEPMPPRIGGCTIWGLEPAVRTSPTETSRIAMNMETWLTAKIRVGEQKVPIAKIHSVATTPNFSYQG